MAQNLSLQFGKFGYPSFKYCQGPTVPIKETHNFYPFMSSNYLVYTYVIEDQT